MAQQRFSRPIIAVEHSRIAAKRRSAKRFWLVFLIVGGSAIIFASIVTGLLLLRSFRSGTLPQRSEMSLTGFQALAPKEPKQFTVLAQFSTSFSERFYDIYLEHEYGPYDTLGVNVRRDSEAGKKLAKLLADGRKHRVTILLQHQGPGYVPTIVRLLAP